ncbi:phage N-6-adenine-methyltransferase [Yersinia frederiksenii]|nr:phage N-6-adenine-methyltransferase [Yersinia frederiksenii]
MSDFGGSHTPDNLKDLWMTPADIFTALDIEFGFYLDAAASHKTPCAPTISLSRMTHLAESGLAMELFGLTLLIPT